MSLTYCTLTDHLLDNYGVHNHGDVVGVPQNKMKNRYLSTHSAELSAGTVMRIDKKISVLNKIKHKIKRKREQVHPFDFFGSSRNLYALKLSASSCSLIPIIALRWVRNNDPCKDLLR